MLDGLQYSQRQPGQVSRWYFLTPNLEEQAVKSMPACKQASKQGVFGHVKSVSCDLEKAGDGGCHGRANEAKAFPGAHPKDQQLLATVRQAGWAATPAFAPG